MKMKRLSIIAAIAVLLTSCVKDLDVTPIDPNVVLPEQVLNTESAFEQLLAKCYVSLCVSGSQGPDSSPDMDGVDGGFGQYVRALFYLQEFTTDEAMIVWNDQTVKDLHALSYTASDVFVAAMYSRIFYQIGLCNEFIRRAKASEFADSENMKTMIAEARALRALSYYHAIDMFGDVPFADETFNVGGAGPDQMSRADLFTWLDNECKDIIENSSIKGAKANVYGRLDVNFVKMIRAHLNLNARVYLGLADDAAAKAYYDVAGTMAKEVMADYPTLRPSYKDLFCGENDQCNDEIIFGIQQDGTNTQSYGATCFIIKASCKGGDTSVAGALGIDDGWGGTLVMPEFMDKFEAADARNLFWGVGKSTTSEKTISTDEFDYGWSAHKFTNLNLDGSNPAITNFVGTDFPLFRAADAYLIAAEVQLRGASTVTAAEGLAALTAVRTRAGVAAGTYDLDNLLDERGRELYWECWRRSDLIRYGLLTSDTYLWTWKGGSHDGRSVDAKYNIFPIPVRELNCNLKLQQNDLWK